MNRLLTTLVGWGLLAVAFGWQGGPQQTPTHEELPARVSGPMRQALRLLRRGKTAEARVELEKLAAANPADAEPWYQIARSHLLDFYQSQKPDPAVARGQLSLAMEALENALKRNEQHIPALKAKAIIHARAELLHYDPNLAYELGARVARLQPHANEYLLNLSEWMSGEVRFIGDDVHRVPHDPLIGLERSIQLLERVVDSALPYSNDEALALFLLGKTLAKHGDFAEAAEYLRPALSRSVTVEQKQETARELGAALYRLGDYGQAARTFYEAFQLRANAVDQWLLRVALDQWKDPPPPLPAAALFPAAEAKIDAANPPMLAFEDMARELGLNRRDGNGTCAWGDYDGDGRLDLLLAGSGAFLALYRNEGRRFREVTGEAGLARVPSGYSVNFVDYDNDGRLDIYLSLNGWSGPLPNRLFRNDGGGKFRDVSRESGAADAGSGFVSLWGDLDNDGDLDFAVANGVLKDGSTPQLYRNDGPTGPATGKAGKFTNVTAAAGVREPPSWGAIGLALGDYDRDGDLDLLINGLTTAPNRLYRNDGAFRFTEVSRQAGVVQPPHNGFVCFFLDYDSDGWPDILTTSLAPWHAVVQGLSKHFAVPDPASVHADAPRLFRNNRNGTFTDVTFQAKLYYPMGVMGAGVADLDNDGRLDLYFGTGDPGLSRLEPNRFFRNNGDGTFSDLTSVVGFARPGNKGHGVTFVDLDDDGDLDVYAQLGGHYPGDHADNAFYRNLRGNRNHWLQVDLVGTSSNRFAVGASLVIKAGGLTLSREVKGSEGFGSTDPYRVHFGLGANQTADSLEIFWPSGKKHAFTGVPANQLIELREDQEAWRRLR